MKFANLPMKDQSNPITGFDWSVYPEAMEPCAIVAKLLGECAAEAGMSEETAFFVAWGSCGGKDCKVPFPHQVLWVRVAPAPPEPVFNVFLVELQITVGNDVIVTRRDDVVFFKYF